MDKKTSTITLTFGDRAENHAGMEIIGSMVDEGMGYNFDDLKTIRSIFRSEGIKSILYDLENNAYVLVVKDGVRHLLQNTGYTIDDFWDEQSQLDVDKKAFMYGRVVNKHARWNLCFDDVAHDPNYEKGEGRVIDFASIPVTKAVYDKFPDYFGEKSAGLKGEGNYYYDVSKCGIGYHGDSERRKVIAIRLGAPNAIYYQWHQYGKPIGDNIQLDVDGGDIYIMSEKAVGTDWKRKNIPTLRHAVGAPKYTDI